MIKEFMAEQSYPSLHIAAAKAIQMGRTERNR